MSSSSIDQLSRSIDPMDISDLINDIDHEGSEIINPYLGAETQSPLRNNINFISNIEGQPRTHPWEVEADFSFNNTYLEEPIHNFRLPSPNSYGSLPDYGYYSPRGSFLMTDKEGDCPICYQTKILKSFGSCRDYFCEDCLRDFFVSELNNFSKASMKCPICQSPSMPNLAAYLLTEEQLQKYKRLIQIFELIESEKMFQWCPAANCEGYAIATRENFNITCNVCSLKFCFNCLKPWHNKHCGTRRGLSYALWAFTHNVKKCPKCKSQTQKNGGCFHMTCQFCRYEYCWTCGDVYKPSHKKSFCYFGRSLFELNCWFILVLMIFPLVFPFIFVFLYDFILQTEGINTNDTNFLAKMLKNRCLMMFFLFVMGPFFITLLLLVIYIGSPILASKKKYRGSVINFLLGMILYQFIVNFLFILGFIVIMLVPVAGVFSIFTKIYSVCKNSKNSSVYNEDLLNLSL